MDHRLQFELYGYAETGSMSHQDKSVTPVTTDSHNGHHFRRPQYRALLCSGVCDLFCKLSRTGDSRLQGTGFCRGELGPSEQLKTVNTRTCVILVEAARPHCGLTLSEFSGYYLESPISFGVAGGRLGVPSCPMRGCVQVNPERRAENLIAVSYTHLTLPTICSV